MSGRLITTSKKSYTPWNPANRLRVERDLEVRRSESNSEYRVLELLDRAKHFAPR